MKTLERGKNWFQINLGSRSFFAGPLYDTDREVDGKYRYKIYSFISRRLRAQLVKDRETKQWEFNFGGMWCSLGSKLEYITYKIEIHDDLYVAPEEDQSL